MLEINYEEKYFSFLEKSKPDSTLYDQFLLKKKAICPEIELSFYKNGIKYQHPVLLDLGFGRKGLLWGGAAAKQLSSSVKSEIYNINEEGAKMSEGVYGSTGDIYFDSVILLNNRVFKNSSNTLVQSGTGLLMSNQVWSGNDVLKQFNKIYLDFNGDIIYIPKNKN